MNKPAYVNQLEELVGNIWGCPAERDTMVLGKDRFLPHKYEDTNKGLVYCVLCGHVLPESQP